VMRLLTLAASTRAVRTTLRGSMIPALTMSVGVGVCVRGGAGRKKEVATVGGRVK
jgi:hypothetical protein